MGTKMKGLFKGWKYISQIFVYKEHELEIGYPTDVRHVAHIGWDSSSVNAPSWMNEFKTTADFSSNTLSNFGSRETSWASQDFDQPRGIEPHSEISVDLPCPDIPKAPKKSTRQKKSKVTSTSGSSRTSRSRGLYATAIENREETRNEYRMA